MRLVKGFVDKKQEKGKELKIERKKNVRAKNLCGERKNGQDEHIILERKQVAKNGPKDERKK